ncbi:MAG: MBL fold metallo-hydrolase [Oligoflexales bacterium]|nr:MBL fold metallo-hydrolase [Oligoflexales bacterium]
MKKVKIKLLGGASAIGASCSVISIGDQNFLIDCGIRFKRDNQLPDIDYLSDIRLDGVFITHAHMDHTGALPLVHNIFPATPVYMTPPTFDLISILFHDALRLMESGLSLEGEFPLYHEKQVESLMQRVVMTHFGEMIVFDDIRICFLPASHILGAAMIHISTPSGSILFTGDYSVSSQRTVPALDMPPYKADIVVTESTYGGRLHSDRNMAESDLVSMLAEICINQGRVLIPAFAIGRAQEVLCIIRQAMQEKRIPEVPIFVDGMVRKVCNVYGRYPRYTTRSINHIAKSGHPFYGKFINPVEDSTERKKVLTTAPCIIVSSSGMLSGGPSAFYAANIAENKNDAILITGYQDEESPGAELLKRAISGTCDEPVDVGGRKVSLNCMLKSYGLSAHADRLQMCSLVRTLSPKSVILVHGDETAKEQLALSLDHDDIVIGRDGLVIERELDASGRHNIKSRPLRMPGFEDICRLIGKDEGPFRVSALAEAFWGRRADLQQLGAFAAAVEETQILQRDDKNRSIFKRVKSSDQTPAADDELESELKNGNPKGKLWEFCQKRGYPFPEIMQFKDDCGVYATKLKIKTGNMDFSTPVFKAKSKMTSQQLACRNLFEQIDGWLQSGQTENEKPITSISEACEGSDHNPVDIGEPSDLEYKPDEGEGVPVYAREPSDSDFVSDTGNSVEVYASEPAASDSLPGISHGALPEDVRPKLNTMMQKNLFSKIEFLLVSQSGPSNNPLFAMIAATQLKNGERVASSEFHAGTKKDAQIFCAHDLYQKLVSHPLVIESLQPATADRKASSPRHVKRISPENLENIISFVRELDFKTPRRLPVHYCKGIAIKAFQEGMHEDGDFIMGQIAIAHEQWRNAKTAKAKVLGYFPFINLDPLSHKFITESYEGWVFQMAQKNLLDPERVFSKWFVQFCRAMSLIGQKGCEDVIKSQGGLFEFVTSAPQWHDSYSEREKLEAFILR